MGACCPSLSIKGGRAVSSEIKDFLKTAGWIVIFVTVFVVLFNIMVRLFDYLEAAP
jgi:hypothetical protein